MSAEGVALIPQCVECGKVWLPHDEDRWQAYWVDNGPDEQLVFYCPECAKREFADDAPRAAPQPRSWRP